MGDVKQFIGIVGFVVRGHLLMVKQHAELWAAVDAIVKDPGARDGNPRAQAKLESRIRSLGALETSLMPGKRGRYDLYIYSRAGWDPARDALIEPGDPIPEKPQICVLFYTVHGRGHGRITKAKYPPALFLTHHCLSRSAQRWRVRTVGDLSVVIERIIRVALVYLLKRGRADSSEAWLDDIPPKGVRLPVSIVDDVGHSNTGNSGEGIIVLNKRLGGGIRAGRPGRAKDSRLGLCYFFSGRHRRAR
jgi:hypothetical protein